MKAIESPLFPFSLNHPFLPTFLVCPPFLESSPSLRSSVRPTFHCANLSGHSFPKSPSLLLLLRWERRYIFLPVAVFAAAAAKSLYIISLHGAAEEVIVMGDRRPLLRRVSSAV